MFTRSFIAAVVIDLCLAGALVIAQNMPVPTTGWATLFMLGVMALQGWSMYLSSEREKAAAARDRINKEAIGAVGDKTEIVHKALNSQLDQFKRDAAESYRAALEQAVKLTRSETEKAGSIITSALEARIAKLESMIEAATARAASISAAAIKEHAVAPSQVDVRLGKIQGEPIK